MNRPEEDVALDTAWKLGRLKVFLNASQKRIYDAYNASRAQNTRYVVNCSRKLGKSVLGLFIATEKAIQTPDALVAFIAPTVKQVESYVRQLYQVAFKGCPELYRPKLMKSELRFNNGSRIIFRGVGAGISNSYDNLRSFAFDLIVLDEAAFSSHLDEIVDSALGPTLLPRNGNMLMLSTPPVTPDHPFKTYVDMARDVNAYSEFTIRDSHYPIDLQDKYIRDAGGMTSAKAQREYFCQFLIDSEFQIIPEWKDEFIQAVEPEKDKYWPYYRKYLALDPGWTDFSVCLYGYYDWLKKQLVILDEVTMKNPEQTTDKLALAIRAKEAELFQAHTTFKRVSDNNAPSLLRDFITRHNLYFSPVESKTMLDVMVSDVRELVKPGGLLVHPRCKQLIGCMRNGVFTKTKTGRRGKEFDRSVHYGHYDAMAALIYLVRELDEDHNPLPIIPETSREHLFISKAVSDSTKSRIGEIIGSGLDEAMQQTFDAGAHDVESYD